MRAPSRPLTASRLLSAFADSTGPLRIALLAALISLPAIAFGFMADDHVLAYQLERGASSFALFGVDHTQVEELRARGGLAWWSSPRLAIDFFRPLASLTHALEFALVPDAPWLMALHNVLLYALTCFVAARIYQRIFASARVAALAALLFTIDEAHAVSAGWISGRNTLQALLFSLYALHFRLRAEEDWRPRFTLASAAAAALALLSGEAGTCSILLLLAHACTLGRGTWSARFVRILPQLVVACVWAVSYLALQRGVHGTSIYRELREPLHALREGLLDLPLSFTSLFGPSIASLSLMLPTTLARVCTLPSALLCAWLVAPGVRNDRASRFFALSVAACLLPSFLAMAQDRVLMGASLGAFGLLAQALDASFARAGLAARVRRHTLLAFHGALALVMFVPSALSVRRFENGTQALSRMAPPGLDVVLVDSPVELLTMYTFSLRGLRGSHRAPPRTLHQLYTGDSELWLERTDARTLEVTATAGWGRVPFQRLFGARADLPRANQERALRNMTVRVLASSDDGRPQRVRFTFPTPLESPERVWLCWQGAQPVRGQPPALGARLRIVPPATLAALPL